MTSVSGEVIPFAIIMVILIKEIGGVVIAELGNRSSDEIISLGKMDGPAVVPLFTPSGGDNTWLTLTVPVRTAACVSLPSKGGWAFFISALVIFLPTLF